MNIQKRPGGQVESRTETEDLELINQLAKTPLTAEKVYRFSVRLCDNEVDRDEINLQDEVEEARAELYREQARKLRIENDAAEKRSD